MVFTSCLTSFRHWGGYAHTRKKKAEDPRKLGNIRKLSKLHRMIGQSTAPRKTENCANTSKNSLKIAIKFLLQCAIPRENQRQSQIPCE